MTKARRLALGCTLVAAIGCMAAQQVTPAQRVELEVLALQTACRELPPDAVASPEVRTVCAAFAPLPVVESRDAGPSEWPVSGDGGPVGLNLDGNGVRRVE